MVSVTLLIRWMALIWEPEEKFEYRKDKEQIGREMQVYDQAKAGAEELGAAGWTSMVTRIIAWLGCILRQWREISSRQPVQP